MIPLSWYMALAVVLFCIGVCGFLTRRNVIIMFLSIELMLNGYRSRRSVHVDTLNQLQG